MSQLFLSVSANQDKTYRFDFGPAGSASVQGYINLSEKSDYTVKSGYGLLTKGASPVIYDDPILLNNIETDGIISDTHMQFRVDLPPGEYWIELLLPAGERSTWRGRILINDEQVVNQIQQYEKNVEGDTPPVTWLTALLFDNDRSFLQFEIEAENQPTALAGLRIFPKEFGTLILQDGILTMTGEMKAPNSELIV